MGLVAQELKYGALLFLPSLAALEKNYRFTLSYRKRQKQRIPS